MRLYTRYRRGRASAGGPAPRSWLFGLLCLGLAGFIGWTWWRHAQWGKPARVPQATATNILAPVQPVTSIVSTQSPSLSPDKSPGGQRQPPKDTNVPPLSTQTSAPPVKPEVRIESGRSDLSSPTARPVQNILEAQIVMTREGISSGSMDGSLGSQTRSALAAYQRKHNLPSTGALDGDTKAAMLLSLPLYTNYVVSSNDLARLLPVSSTWLGKSEQPRLDYETALELVAEKAFAHPNLIRRLNAGVNWTNLAAGTVITIPRVEYPPPVRAAQVKISLSQKVLEAFDTSSNLLVHFPCSIGKLAEKRPVGELSVSVVAPNPNYTFNPDVFPESAEARQIGRKLILPPGPNNPVGAAWIGLDRPGYGIHGTPAPEQVGRTESHGCFRLANWNAEYLLKLVAVGTPIRVEP